MTVALNQAMITSAVGDDLTSVIPYPFKAYESEDIGVKVRLVSTGVETDLVETTDYTVDGILEQGGNVTLVDASQAWLTSGKLKTGYTIYIYFKVNVKQLAEYRDLGRHAPIAFEKTVDRITSMIKSMLSVHGSISRALKLPSSVHSDEFDEVLPSGFNSAEDNVLAVNATLDAFKVRALPSAADVTALETFISKAYVPSAVQTINAGGTMTITAHPRQHIRVQSSGGVLALSTTPFGTNTALFVDGMEIVVESQSSTNYLTLLENDAASGYIGNGALRFKRGDVITFIYSSALSRFLVKSNGAF